MHEILVFGREALPRNGALQILRVPIDCGSDELELLTAACEIYRAGTPSGAPASSGESPDSRERAPGPDVIRQPLLEIHVAPSMVIVGLRVGLAAAPVHAVFVGTVVSFGPHDDDACAFG